MKVWFLYKFCNINIKRKAIIPLSSSFSSSTTKTPSIPTNDEFLQILNHHEFTVLRQASTEPSFFSETTEGELEYELKKEYNTKFPKEGTFSCKGCGISLFTAKSKFDSGCGWPAFYEGIKGNIQEKSDYDRTEIICNNCKSHLGHIFRNEGFCNPTNERHCVNGVCLTFQPPSNEKN
jgi:peptide-methionine (R)-S-oxide reductase